MTKDNKMLAIIEEQQLDDSDDLKKVFTPFFDQVDKVKAACSSIKVTDESQVEEMEKAREFRLKLKELRCAAEDERKKLKETSLRRCQAIDALGRYLKSEIEPMETYLKGQEEFAKRLEEARKDKVEAERKAELDKYDADYEFVSLREMPEENYMSFLSGAQKAYQLKKEKKEAEEKARLEREKKEREEQERIRKENERLKKEAGAKEKALAEERKKAKEAEARAKKEEEDRKRAEEEARNKAERAPDKKKLEALAVNITSIEMPKVKSKEAQEIVKAAVELLNKTSNYIKEKTINL